MIQLNLFHVFLNYFSQSRSIEHTRRLARPVLSICTGLSFYFPYMEPLIQFQTFWFPLLPRLLNPRPVQYCAHRALISISVRGNTAMGTIHSSYLGVSSVYEETLLLNILDSGMWLIIKLTSNHHISSSCLSLYHF